MHLLSPSGGATRMADRVLSLITSYENGTVKLWQYRNIEKERSIEGLGWECLWSFKQHVESGKRIIVPTCCFFQLTYLRNCDDSHGNNRFTRPFYRPLGVSRPPYWAVRSESMWSTHTSSQLHGKIVNK
jgi:hypothetical protein